MNGFYILRVSPGGIVYGVWHRVRHEFLPPEDIGDYADYPSLSSANRAAGQLRKRGIRALVSQSTTRIVIV